MRKSELDGRQEIIKRGKVTVVMSFLSIGITVIMLLIISLLIENEILPPEVSELSSAVVIILMTFICAMIAVKQLQAKTLISGLSVSVLTVLILLTGSLFFKGRGEPSILILGGCTVSGLIAGLIGSRKKKIR